MKEQPLSILILNQNWFLDELRELGHRVVWAGWKNFNPDVVIPHPGAHLQEIFRLLPAGFKPDVVVYHDNSGPIGILGFEELEIPCVFYSVDSHHHLSWHRYFAAAFDRVLVAQRDYVQSFAEVNPNSSWFPLWVSTELTPQEQRPINVSFRGNLDPDQHPERALFFSELSKYIEVDAKTGPFVDVYPASKIVVNQNVKDDVNFRTFEAVSSGALLITPYSQNGLKDLFVIGEEIVTYQAGDAEDAAQKVSYYLENEAERKRIAEAGYKRVLRDHSRMARARQLEDLLLNLSPSERGLRYFGAGVTSLVSSNICRKMGDVLANRMLLHSAKCLKKSASLQESANLSYESAMLQCVFLLQEFGYVEQAFELAAQTFLSYPTSQLMTMSYIDMLLKRGMNEMANTTAVTVSSDPVNLIAQIPNLVESVRESLLRTMTLSPAGTLS